MSLDHLDKHLFDIFHRHTLNSPEAHYLLSEEGVLSYGEANDIIYGISQLITQSSSPEVDTIILRFRDQTKLLFSFWACAALQKHIVLVPDDPPNIEHEFFGSNSFLVLSDVIDSWDSLDFDMTNTSEPANWQLTNNSKANAAHIYFFTSGTTGRSKLIKTSYYQMISAINCITLNGMMPYTYSQNVFLSIPLFHSYGISAVVEYTMGRSCITLPKQRSNISPLQTLLNKTISGTLTAIEGVPYFYKQLAAILERVRLPNICHIGLGGDVVSSELLQTLHRTIDNRSFSIRYGVTEIPSVIGLALFEPTSIVDTRSLGSILPIYNVFIRNESGTVSSENIFGELIIGCSHTSDETHLVSTNDIVKRADNHLIHQGRTTFIKHRGYKINPIEIETCINRHLGVSDSKVYLNNNSLIADIIKKKQDLDFMELKTFLGRLLPASSVPDSFIEVAVIERTRTGKIRR